MAKYYGFSSVNKRSGSTVLVDSELAKRDLLNHFYTRKGERVMNPAFGSIIWDLLFDPVDDYIRSLAKDDVERIIGLDPRWSINEVFIISEREHSIEVRANIVYVSSGSVEQLYLNFESETI